MSTVSMTFSKETESKYRWDADVEGVKFELYIPKWRVPQPVPETLVVKVLPEQAAPGSAQKTSDPREPILCRVRKFREHTETVRYRPVRRNWGDDPEIGEPYVPYSLLPGVDVPDQLTIVVEWET